MGLLKKAIQYNFERKYGETLTSQSTSDLRKEPSIEIHPKNEIYNKIYIPLTDNPDEIGR